MKNRIFFLLCVFVVSFSLTACKDEKPYIDTEHNSSQIEEDSSSERNEMIESSETTTDSGIQFLDSDIIFYKTLKERYDSRLKEGHVVAVISTRVEWQSWLDENMPGYTTQDKVFEFCNMELFNNNYLVIYQGDLEKQGHQTSGIEKIYIRNNDIQIEEFHLYNESLLVNGQEQNYYIPYHMCWVRRTDMTELVYEKHKQGNYYVLEGDCAYFTYYNIFTKQVGFKGTKDGGVTWITKEAITNVYEAKNAKTDAYWINRDCGYVILTSDSPLGWRSKGLWWTEDGGENWQSINVTRQIQSEPKDMMFFTEDAGCIITDYVASPLSSSIGYLLYCTIDGGKTWTGYQLEKDVSWVEEMRASKIERISEKEAKIYVEIIMAREKESEGNSVETKSAYVEVIYYTDDAGRTWKRLHN